MEASMTPAVVCKCYRCRMDRAEAEVKRLEKVLEEVKALQPVRIETWTGRVEEVVAFVDLQDALRGRWINDCTCGGAEECDSCLRRKGSKQ